MTRGELGFGPHKLNGRNAIESFILFPSPSLLKRHSTVSSYIHYRPRYTCMTKPNHIHTHDHHEPIEITMSALRHSPGSLLLRFSTIQTTQTLPTVTPVHVFSAARSTSTGPSSSPEKTAPRPKISDESVPGADGSKKLTKEQKEDVERHNRDFDQKHSRDESTVNGRVDKGSRSDENH
jgi:hypothetical protein